VFLVIVTAIRLIRDLAHMALPPTFEGTWAFFRARLRSGTIVKLWSANGYTGGNFKVDNFDPAAITVIPAGKKPRPISREDFHRVYRQWPVYTSGKINRSELGQITGSQHTSYILSLFHWLDE
jgi:hypothetical protein